MQQKELALVGWIFMEVLGTISMDYVVVLWNLCLLNNAGATMGTSSGEPESRQLKADWMYSEVLMPLCMPSRWYRKFLLWYWWMLCSGRVGFSPQSPKCARENSRVRCQEQ